MFISRGQQVLAQKQDTGRSKVEFIPFLTELRVATVLDEVIEIMARVRMDFALAVVISHFSWGRQSSRVLHSWGCVLDRARGCGFALD